MRSTAQAEAIRLAMARGRAMAVIESGPDEFDFLAGYRLQSTHKVMDIYNSQGRRVGPKVPA